MNEEIFKLLESHRDERLAVSMSNYIRNQFAFLGIPSPLRRNISSPYLKDISKNECIDWNFVEICWAKDYREAQYVAMDYLTKNQKKLGLEDISNLKQLIIKKSWWDTVDGLDRIVGSIALRYPEANNIMIEWSESKNIWLRRVAIDHQLLRKDKTNVDLLEQIIINNLGTNEFFINKAIGWVLRDYSKTNPEWVKNFIEKYRLQLSKLSLREAGKYLR